MSATPKPITIRANRADDRLPLHVFTTIRANLGLLLFIDAALSIATLPVIATVWAGGYLMAPVVAMLLVGPFWMGAVAVTDDLARDTVASPWNYLRLVRRHAARSIGISLAPAAVAVILLGTLDVFSAHPDKKWLAIPLFADCSVAVLVVIACFSAYSLGAIGLRGRSLWAAALTRAASRPAATAGSFALVILIGLAIVRLTPLAALLAAPFAVLLSTTHAPNLASNQDEIVQEKVGQDG